MTVKCSSSPPFFSNTFLPPVEIVFKGPLQIFSLHKEVRMRLCGISIKRLTKDWFRAVTQTMWEVSLCRYVWC